MYHRAATSYAHAMINRELSDRDDELEIHLDSILVYLRVFADTIAAAIPYLYEPSRDNMPFRSFREQTKWFINVRPDYDPDYTAILLSGLEWFELLAGKRGRGVRDLLIHHFAHIQATVTIDPPDVRGQITAGMISEHGYVHNDLPALLTTIVDGLFQFLDALVYHHIRRIVARTKWMALPLGEPYAGEFYRFDVSPASHWLYPIRSGFTDRP